MTDRRRILTALLPLISGIALVLAYAPFSIPLLPFVGFVPLFLWLDTPRSAKSLAVGGLVFGLAYLLGNEYWMFLLGRFTPAGYPGAAGAITLQLAAFFIFPIAYNVVNHKLSRPWWLPLAAPFLWVVSEHARAYGDFYFPWVTLGYSLADWPALIQHADLIGVYGISWWLMLINAAVAGAVLARRSRRQLRWYVCVLVAALLLPAGYNVVRWRQIARVASDAPVLNVALVQPNIPQEQKWSRFTVDSIYEKLNALVAEAESTSPDLIVAPEASLPLPIREGAARLPDDVAPGRTPLLIGALEGIDEGQERRSGNRTITVYGKHHNAAILAAADRTVIGTSDKRFLVPVTEQIPYKTVFGFLLPMMSKQFGRMMAAGNSEPLVLPTSRGPVPFGALVCYEALFPSLCRDLHNHGARFLAVITNDAWFGRTSFPYQHLGIAVLRAIENRTSIVRSANTGISSITDPLGRTTVRTAIFQEAKLAGPIALMQGKTFYARAGDLVLDASYPALLALLAAAWISHRRSRAGSRR